MTDDTEEVDVELTTFDMDHLSEGQPVFKQGSGDTRLVLRFENCEEWQAVPKEDLRALVEEWRKSEEHMASQGVDEWADGIKQCADDLEDLL